MGLRVSFFEDTNAINSFKKAKIIITYEEKNDRPYSYYKDTNINKEINLIYNNDNVKNYNFEDEKYIQNLKIEIPQYFEYNLEKLKDDTRQNKLMGELAEEYLINLINDNSITIECYNGAGDANPLNAYGSLEVKIFKDGILYNVISTKAMTIPIVMVPSIINDKDIEEYALNLVKKKFENDEWFDSEKFTIVKGTKGYVLDFYGIKEIVDGYTLLYDGEDVEDVGWRIIIRKEIEQIDITTNIKLDTDTKVVPDNTILVAEEIKEEETINIVRETLKEETLKFVTYNITLKSDGVEIQPSGNVKISIPIPEGYDESKISVYRVENDGTKIKYDATIQNGYIIFETDHFSTYVVAQESDYQLGDVNKDGTVNAKDATLILKYLAKKVELTDEQLALADTDRDGRVKASDAVRILKYVAKKISEI